MLTVNSPAVVEMHERVIDATACNFQSGLILRAVKAHGDNLNDVIQFIYADLLEQLNAATPGTFEHQCAASCAGALSAWIAWRAIGRAVMNHNVLGTADSREVARLALLEVEKIGADAGLVGLLARSCSRTSAPIWGTTRTAERRWLYMRSARKWLCSCACSRGMSGRNLTSC